jgi:hypothetical protein
MALKGGERLNGGEKACTKGSTKGSSKESSTKESSTKDGEGLLASLSDV